MSEETHQALVEALEAHILAETPTHFIGDWVLVASMQDPAVRKTSYFYTSSPTGVHSKIGLIEMAKSYFDRKVAAAD